MAKKVTAEIKLQCPAGKATPSPPVGPALGQHGVNIMEFVKQFNSRTAGQEGMTIPVVITVFADRSFTFITKTPPAAVLIKKELGLPTQKVPGQGGAGSSEPGKVKVGTLTWAQVENVAKTKMPDLNANDIEAAKKIIAGTARSMGVDVE